VSDYLFEKVGEDPEIEHLERVLRPLAYRGQAPKLPRPKIRTRKWPIPAVAFAAAAAIVLAIFLRSPKWIEGPRTLAVSTIGSVELGTDTRARFLEKEKLELAYGHLSAKIDAPPRRFSVKTRRFTVIDLGCAFSLDVDRDGRGKVVVTEGKVALSDGLREIVVLAGASSTFDDQGVTTPSLPHVSAPEPAIPEKPAPKLVPKRPEPPKKIESAKKPEKKLEKKIDKKIEPAKKSAAPIQKNAPAKKKDDGIHLEHDPFRDAP